MRIEARKLREQPVDLQVHCAAADLQLADEEFRFLDPVEGMVHFSVAGDDVLARGRIAVKVETECVRCLAKFELALAPEIAVTYEHNPELLNPRHEFADTDKEPAIYFDGETIHPEPELREAIMLDLPSQPICGESCRGLCPVCGTNLNTASCACSAPGAGRGHEAPWKNAIRNIKLS